MRILLIVSLAALFVLAVVWIIMLLWNGCLVGTVDGVHHITFWKTLGVFVLTSLLFKDRGGVPTSED